MLLILALQPRYCLVNYTGVLDFSFGLGSSSDLSKLRNFYGFIIGTSKLSGLE